MDGSSSSTSLQHWVLDVTKWLDPTRYTLQVEVAKVSITALVLTDLYPMIQSCLQSPPFPVGGPPTLLYGQGPWSGENLCTALEFFFQNNAYHPQASCDKCGHTGCVPLSVKAPPAAIAELPREVGNRGGREATESERTPEQRGESRDTFGEELSEIRRTRATGLVKTGSGDHRGSHPQVSDHHPAHRQIVNFCEVCLQRGSILCEVNPPTRLDSL
jgi:hypothetical protein